jgi:protein gp37
VNRPEPVMLTLRTHTGQPVPYRQPQAKPTFHETTGEGVSWAGWSWGIITGCMHGCRYCYARAIVSRFTNAHPAGFTPLYHRERLDAPANTKIPARCEHDPAYRRVFVGPLADMFGRWVPLEWIEEILAVEHVNPQWEYLHLTKFPDRYPEIQILPSTAWIGTSVDEQKRVRIAERAFTALAEQQQRVKVRWLSLEPLKEHLEFTDLSMFDWVVIGAQTASVQPDGVGYVPAFDPPAEWVLRITDQAHEAGVPVHWKPNLRRAMTEHVWSGGDWVDEYPAGMAA